MVAQWRRLIARLQNPHGGTPRRRRSSYQPSPPSQGFLGEHLYYRDSRWRVVEATCVDVSTDWVPLFEIQVIDPGGEVIESIANVRGYTELRELAESRGWQKRGPSLDQLAREMDAPESPDAS